MKHTSARAAVAAALLGGALWAGRPAHAQAASARQLPPDTSAAVLLDTVRVGSRIDDLIGVAATASEGLVGAIDLHARPIAREGDLLEAVPGVIVTQHSGEGKANQYFIRGFNLDHGTDFQTRVEGMPVNMPSHGHGQGYTDLNFVIPEFVQLLDYRLGVYHAELGDFGSAGGAELHLTRTLDRPFVSLGLGPHGLARAVVGGASPVPSGTLLAGGEAKVYDGPWERPGRVRKLNGLARYSRDRGRTRLSVLALAYANRWNANDQIPRRAVESGTIGRFGQVDSTDGGESRRFSLSGSWSRLGERWGHEVQLFGIVSDLALFSNFTYLLDDPTGGDQFNQTDRRLVLGGNAKHSRAIQALGLPHSLTVGLQTRADLIDELGLYRTVGRRRTGTVREDRVVETGTGAFLEALTRWSPRVRSVLALRADGYTFDVQSDLATNSGRERAGILSPKASLVFAPSAALELYLSGGFGFHSNDARGVTITEDPVSGEAARRVDPLVRSRGAEVGLRAAPVEGFRSTLTLWALTLDSELLFVGDAGATQPTAASRRSGVTWANFYRPLPALALDADLSLARARLLERPEGENRIPGAIESIFGGGMAWTPERGLFGAIRLRHMGEYPLTEDNAARAEAATLLNAEIGYRLGSGARLEIAVLNLLDSRAADIQYFYASRLEGEPAGGVEDVHFHPVEPRQVRASLHWVF